jgi:putative SOS response-associated peptidase YedK
MSDFDETIKSLRCIIPAAIVASMALTADHFKDWRIADAAVIIAYFAGLYSGKITGAKP